MVVCFHQHSSALGFTRTRYRYAMAPVRWAWSRGARGRRQLAVPGCARHGVPGVLVDSGWAVARAVAVGGFQMDNNLLLFDEAASRPGFTGTLLCTTTTCGNNFNFSGNEQTVLSPYMT